MELYYGLVLSLSFLNFLSPESVKFKILFFEVSL